MENNRYIPYGYCVQGKIAVHPEEAEVVKRIYEDYQNGQSYKIIAERLTAEEIPFLEGRCDWNKNRIKRILEDKRYTGLGGYPSILSDITFETVQHLIATRRTNGREKEVPTEKAIRRHLRCAECGKRYKRWSASATRVWWACEDTACRTDFKFTPEQLFNAVMEAFYKVISNPALLCVDTGERRGFHPTMETIRLRNEIHRLLDKPRPSQEELVELVLQELSARYDACTFDPAPHITATLQTAYAAARAQDSISPELIDQSVSAVTIAHDGQIHIRFVNGASVSGKILP